MNSGCSGHTPDITSAMSLYNSYCGLDSRAKCAAGNARCNDLAVYVEADETLDRPMNVLVPLFMSLMIMYSFLLRVK